MTAALYFVLAGLALAASLSVVRNLGGVHDRLVESGISASMALPWNRGRKFTESEMRRMEQMKTVLRFVIAAFFLLFAVLLAAAGIVTVR